MENNRETLATQMKKLKISKLTGVTDRDGNNLMHTWDMYQYLNNQVANRRFPSLRAPKIAQ
eukprot:10994264-Prorocentrum_lima.AAC.1